MARKKTGGRKRGTPNKTTTVIKEAVALAFAGMGGQKNFTEWAKANPTDFYTKIATKLIPTELTSDPDQPMQMKVSFGGRYKPDGSQ